MKDAPIATVVNRTLAHRTDPQVFCRECGRQISVMFVGGVFRYAVHNRPEGFRCWYSYDLYERRREG